MGATLATVLATSPPGALRTRCVTNPRLEHVSVLAQGPGSEAEWPARPYRNGPINFSRDVVVTGGTVVGGTVVGGTVVGGGGAVVVVGRGALVVVVVGRGALVVVVVGRGALVVVVVGRGA